MDDLENKIANLSIDNSGESTQSATSNNATSKKLCFDEIVNQVVEKFVKRIQSNSEVETKKYRAFSSKNKSFDTIHLDNWATTIREKLLQKYYSNFDLNDLKMIVLGSSGVMSPVKYNTVRALVVDKELVDSFKVPPALKNLIGYLNKARPSKNVQVGEETAEEMKIKYDFECKELMKGVLFINTCLKEAASESPKFNSEHFTNSICTIQFVNEILNELKDVRKIAILDLRITMHTHIDNMKSVQLEKLDEDSTSLKLKIDGYKEGNYEPLQKDYEKFYKACQSSKQLSQNDKDSLSDTIGQDVIDVYGDLYYQTLDWFKIVNPATKDAPNGYHRYVRLGNSGKLHYHSTDEAYCVKQLRKLINEEFPIDKLFEPKPNSQTSK